MKNGKRRFCVISGHLQAEYYLGMALGIKHAAYENDIDITFVSTVLGGAFYNDYIACVTDYQANMILEYINEKEFDALIISSGALRRALSLSKSGEFETYIANFDPHKLIIIEDQIPGYCCLSSDNYQGQEQIIRHMVEVHGYKKIGYLSGEKGYPECMERLQAYYDVMREYGLEIAEGMIQYCPLSDAINDQLDAMITAHPDIEAICCANDNIADGVYRQLPLYGLRTGVDVAVAGFDDSTQASFLYPPMTTVRFSIYDIGYNAVLKAIELLQGEEISCFRVDTKLIVRNSCGCRTKSEKIDDINEVLGDIKRTANEQAELLLDKSLKHNLSGSLKLEILEVYRVFLTELLQVYKSNPDELIKRPNKHIGQIRKLLNSKFRDFLILSNIERGISGFIRCLAESSDIERNKKILEFEKILTETIIANMDQHEYKYIRQLSYQSWLQSFIDRDTLANTSSDEVVYREIMKRISTLGIHSSYLMVFDKPYKYVKAAEYHIPDGIKLVASQHGKTIETFENVRIYPFEVITSIYLQREPEYPMFPLILFMNEYQYGILICSIDIYDFEKSYHISLNISNALSFLNTIRQVEQKQKVLNRLSQEDIMTGIYNRRGFFEQSTQFCRKNEGDSHILFMFDLDHLKEINDTFGHAEGDFAITETANILKKVFENDKGVIARIGGDEFAVLLTGDEYTVCDRISSMEEIEEELNSQRKKPYYIEISYGYSLFVSRYNTEISIYMNMADKMMYQNRKEKRAKVEKVD